MKNVFHENIFCRSLYVITDIRARPNVFTLSWQRSETGTRSKNFWSKSTRYPIKLIMAFDCYLKNEFKKH